MALTLKLEPENLGYETLERCCFCRASTPYWTTDPDGNVTGESVACCQKCGSAADIKDVPTKRVWFRREFIVAKGAGWR